MNEFIPPITKYEITADEFLKAARGEAFEQTDWFYKVKLGEIRKRIDVETTIWNDDEEYIILREANCTLPPKENYMNLSEIREPSYKPAFIFDKCNLPGIVINECHTNGWVFISTEVRGVGCAFWVAGV